MRSGLMVSMAAKAADEGRGAGAMVMGALVVVLALTAMWRMMKNKRRLLRMMRSVAPEMHPKGYGKSPLYERSDSAGQWREVSQAVASGRWPVVRQAVVRKAIPLDIPIGWAQGKERRRPRRLSGGHPALARP